MKKISIILAAAAAALSLASCNKEPMAEQPSSGIVFNISVANLDGSADTKAVKTAWEEGDKINIWLGSYYLGNGPHAILTYDAANAKWVGETTSSFESAVTASGPIRALYEGYNDFSKYSSSTANGYASLPGYNNTYGAEMPIAVASTSSLSYSYDGTTLSASISWQYLTNVQVVVTGLDPEKASSYSLKSPNLTRAGSFYSASSSNPYINTGYETTGGYTKGVANEDGVAFYFTSKYKSAECNKENTWEFTLCDNTGSEPVEYTYSAVGNISSSIYSLNAIKIKAGKFFGVTDAVDLSAEETSNSYMISEPGTYKFNATVRGNGVTVDGLAAPAAIAPDAAKLVWQSANGMISDIKVEDGYIVFTASEAAGNAVIAGTMDGTIVWSWHIWNPGVEVKALPTATGYELMDLNLGATNKGERHIDVNTFGLLYQWGRKDPFPGSPTLTGTTSTMPIDVYDENGKVVSMSYSSWSNSTYNTIEYSIEHPTVVLTNYAQFSTSRDWLRSGTSIDALWGNPLGDERDSNTNTYPNKGSKTYYDPCPAGWRVPPVDVFRDATPSGGYDENYANYNVADVDGDGVITPGDYNFGWVLYLDKDNDVKTFMPSAARYDGSYGMLYGSMAGLWGNWWSNASSSNGLAVSPLSFQKTATGGTSMSPNAAGSRADAYSVRCIRDTK